MQEYKTIPITKDEIVPTALRMRHDGRYLVMIHGYLEKDGSPHISWDYAVGNAVESYYLVGETQFPSIADIYDEAARFPEVELHELMDLEFEGLDTSARLFLPEDMLETQGKGQIVVTPLSELREKRLEMESEG
jgi:hypothetical protein